MDAPSSLARQNTVPIDDSLAATAPVTSASPRSKLVSPRARPVKETVVIGDDSTIKKALHTARFQDPCLLVVNGTPLGAKYSLNELEMTIGRDPECKIRLPDQSVSRKHATFKKTDAGVSLTDLGSANGTWVDDKKVSKSTVDLQPNSLIKLGSTMLKFVMGEESYLFGSLGSAARIDSLTKAHNKAHFLDELNLMANGDAEHVSLLFLDLDFFKKVNDTLGHTAGDFVLREVSKLVAEKFLPKQACFARYGGEEFVILVPSSAQEASNLAEKIRDGIEKHQFMLDGKTKIPVTVSIGVAEMGESSDAGDLIKTADKALYKAKETGRNKVVVLEE